MMIPPRYKKGSHPENYREYYESGRANRILDTPVGLFEETRGGMAIFPKPIKMEGLTSIKSLFFF